MDRRQEVERAIRKEIERLQGGSRQEDKVTLSSANLLDSLNQSMESLKEMRLYEERRHVIDEIESLTRECATLLVAYHLDEEMVRPVHVQAVIDQCELLIEECEHE